ncbi:MAG: ABC transporter permease [Planctomycetes bacterium]|nr:ABC transporter permease [Planctomycetota bacterium]
MIVLLVRRLVWMAITLWGVFTVSFFLMRAVPGGPFSKERKLDPVVQRNIERRYDLDKPLYWQYGNSLIKTARVDLGPSMRLRDFSVNEVIAQGLPISASLGILALSFALALGISTGVVAALWRNTAVDWSLMSAATLGIAVPNFWLASVGIVLFVFVLPIFPAAGWGSPWQLVLPVICLGAPYAAYIARLTRTGMLDVLSQDYIRTARAKGLGPSRVVVHHALKGALLPVVSFLGPASADILMGSLIVEQIFFLPGLGSHFVEAATQRDYPLAMGMVLTYTVMLYLMNTLVDVSYRLLDPRVVDR